MKSSARSSAFARVLGVVLLVATSAAIGDETPARAANDYADLGHMRVTATRTNDYANLGHMLVSAARANDYTYLGGMLVTATRPGDARVALADLGEMTVTARRLTTVAGNVEPPHAMR